LAVGVDRVGNFDGGALAGELVDHVQQFQGAPVDSDIELEVHCPDDVGEDRHHCAYGGADTGETLAAPFLRHP